jgi:hypothetical protein
MKQTKQPASSLVLQSLTPEDAVGDTKQLKSHPFLRDWTAEFSAQEAAAVAQRRKTNHRSFIKWEFKELAISEIDEPGSFQPLTDFNLDKSTSSESAQILKIRFPLAAGAKIKRVRIRFVLEIDEGGSEWFAHHAAIPRLKGTFLWPLNRPLDQGPGTLMAASYYFNQSVGDQPLGLYPPLIVISPASAMWLIAPLSETTFNCAFQWDVRWSRQVVIDVLLTARGVDSLEIPHDQDCLCEQLFVQTFAGPTQLGPAIFEDYAAQLQSALGKTRARFRPIRESEVIWGSWNDRNIRDIDEAMFVENVRWISRNMPTVRWIQVDDGWQELKDGLAPSVATPKNMADLGLFDTVDRKRFPRGMRFLSDAIREAGLRPMLWVAPSIMANTPLFQQHPEWFQPETRLHYIPDLRMLDFSLPEVRSFVQRALDTMFVDWKFEGCKLDFWPYAFDLPSARFRDQQYSSVHWVKWFLKELRDRIPEDGMFMHCMDMPMGTPFRSVYFDEFRCYGDVEELTSKPDLLEEQPFWTAYLVGLVQVQRRFWSPDSDGIGIFEKAAWPDPQWRLWCSFLLGSGTMAEVAGRFDRPANPHRVEMLKRAVAESRLGRQVTLPGYDWESAGSRAPKCWVRHDSPTRRIVGLTNWDHSAMQITLTAEMVALENDTVRVREIWSDRTLTLPASISIPPRDGMTFVTQTA